MTDIAGSHFEWLEFDEDGDFDQAGAAHRVNQALHAADATDIVVMSHGWRNDRNDASTLYSDLWRNTARRLAELGRDATRYVIAGVSWPAIKFRDPFDLPSVNPGAGTAPTGSTGSAMSVGGSTDDVDLDLAEFRNVVDQFVELLDSDAARNAREKAAAYVQDRASPRELVEAMRAALPVDGADIEEELDLRPLSEDPGEILGSLALPPVMPVSAGIGQAQGMGDTIHNLISGPRAAAARLFGYATYYVMKKRAGTVGASLGRNLLPMFRADGVLRIHLVGHSFGARLVTAALNATPAPLPHSRLHSLTLLQGAFSHNALAPRDAKFPDGAFVGSHHKLEGPAAITHTHNDKAVTLAYALASRLSRDNSKSIGDASDQFGAIGSNGALRIDADCCQAQLVLTPGGTYELQPKKVHNVKGDACISAHFDVTNAQVARLVASALA